MWVKRASQWMSEANELAWILSDNISGSMVMWAESERTRELLVLSAKSHIFSAKKTHQEAGNFSFNIRKTKRQSFQTKKIPQYYVSGRKRYSYDNLVEKTWRKSAETSLKVRKWWKNFSFRNKKISSEKFVCSLGMRILQPCRTIVDDSWKVSA